ncbi:hypothetical protein [Xanthocytophaga agilis]|uniref:Uncharacterized protein n=1 Tax=Xanthocytophaga agilis TaxID=3048010 RepID=A0AAE3UGP4_9BACT|nr:hypothetical protein [Xanthocytophaga agilis]MDJ1501813.1 hypothetical protein [Xanthocytophaga agilis]
MFKLLIKLFCVFLFIISGILFFFYLKTYNLPYNSEGRYFDPEHDVVHHEQVVIPYLVISIFLFIVSVVLFIFQAKLDKK